MAEALKMLICDDSALIRKKLKSLLETKGYVDIIEAGDGEQAVEQYKEHRPDVVFMDIVMPLKTGIEALKEIREVDPSGKVVMASSVGTQGNLLDAIKNGAFDFVQKPITEEAVVRVLDKVLNERRQA